MSMHRQLMGVAAAAIVAGCAHDPAGHEIRTGAARFDATSVTSPKVVVTLQDDGTWGQMGGNRYERVGDELRLIGPGVGSFHGPPLIRPYASVRIDHLPNGLQYTPSYPGSVWTFVTEDGKALPPDLEVPLFFAARIGLGGQWVNIWQPAIDDTGPHLEPDCGLVLFQLQDGRQVAGWLVNREATCPKPRYPGREALARLIYTRNEVWVTPERPSP